MGRGFDKPWMGGVDVPWVGDQNTMDRGVDIYVPLVGGQNTMSRVLDIPSVGGSIYHR